MSTNSRIGIECSDGVYSIYCHWDGYTEHVGTMLKEHYETFDKACELVHQGDASSIYKHIGSKHDFNGHSHGECTFYYRDRDEPWESVRYVISPTVDDYVESLAEQYTYLFKGGRWLVYDSEVNEFVEY